MRMPKTKVLALIVCLDRVFKVQIFIYKANGRGMLILNLT